MTYRLTQTFPCGTTCWESDGNYDGKYAAKDGSLHNSPEEATERNKAVEKASIVKAAYEACLRIIEESPTYHRHCLEVKPGPCHCEICAYVRGNVTEFNRNIADLESQIQRLTAEMAKVA